MTFSLKNLLPTIASERWLGIKGEDGESLFPDILQELEAAQELLLQHDRDLSAGTRSKKFPDLKALSELVEKLRGLSDLILIESAAHFSLHDNEIELTPHERMELADRYRSFAPAASAAITGMSFLEMKERMLDSGKVDDQPSPLETALDEELAEIARRCGDFNVGIIGDPEKERKVLGYFLELEQDETIRPHVLILKLDLAVKTIQTLYETFAELLEEFIDKRDVLGTEGRGRS